MPRPRGRDEAMAALFAYYVATGRAPAWKRIRLDTSLPSEWTVRRFWQESLHAACREAGIPEEAFQRTLDRTATKVRGRPAKEGSTVIRTCLRCDENFKSAGPHNRLCEVCRRHTDADGISDRYQLIAQHWRTANPLED